MRMIAALDSRHGIATDTGIPWKLPTDQHFFSEQTADGLILLGYDTYLEVARPLHGRTNYVATRKTGLSLREGFDQVTDVDAFLAEHGDQVVQNIGGAGLFSSTLHLADELVLTRIDGDFGCTKFFPAFEDRFELASESEPITENGATFTFQWWHPRS